jgi:16S rRNA (guanine966-N2)-methyltransferase
MSRQYVRPVRVIAGELRGRKLTAPAGRTTRPTSDRVREATFNALVSMGAVDDARVLDGFAGSGALGIEALSRGAAHCTFVERDRTALAALRTNLEALQLGPDRATVVATDVLATTGAFDLALLDPPYAFEGWNDLLSGIDADVVVCESGAAVDPPPMWMVARSKTYGATVVTILRRPDPRSQEDLG